MTITVWEQAHSLLGALLLGVGAGLWYDLLRALRWRIRSPALGIGLDLLFWLAVTALLFGWSVAAGNGTVQLFTCVGALLGGILYFRWLSSLFFPFLSTLLGWALRLIKLLLKPLYLLKEGLRKLENFFIDFCKKHFSFPDK